MEVLHLVMVGIDAELNAVESGVEEILASFAVPYHLELVRVWGPDFNNAKVEEVGGTV